MLKKNLDVELKVAITSACLSPEKDTMNQDENKSAKRGAQIIPIEIPIISVCMTYCILSKQIQYSILQKNPSAVSF